MNRSLWAKVGVSAGLVVVAVSVIIYTASQSSGLFRFVDEVRAEQKSLKDREVWMAGSLEAGSHQVRRVRGQREEHRFELSHKGQSIQVRYVGSMPQNAQPGRQLIIRGRLGGEDLFVAEEIRTKCPSKYKSQYEAGR